MMASPRKSGDAVRELRRYDVFWTVLAVVAIVVITVPQIRFSDPDYKPGDIAETEVAVPIDLTVPDPVSTERRLTEADQSVLDVYDYRPQAHEYGKRIVQRLFAWGRLNIVNAGIVWDDLPEEARFDLEQKAMAVAGYPLPEDLVGALSTEDAGFSMVTELAVAGTLISFSEENLIGMIEQTRLGASAAINVRDTETQEERRLPDTGSVLGMESARAELQLALTERLVLTEKAEETLKELVSGLLAANLNYSSNATQQRRREASSFPKACWLSESEAPLSAGVGGSCRYGGINQGVFVPWGGGSTGCSARAVYVGSKLWIRRAIRIGWCPPDVAC